MKYLYTFTGIDNEGNHCEGELVAEGAVSALAIIQGTMQFASCIRQHAVGDDRRIGITSIVKEKEE